MHEYHKLTVQWCKVDSETPWENTTLGGGGGYKMITVQWSKAPWENTTLGREGGGYKMITCSSKNAVSSLLL